MTGERDLAYLVAFRSSAIPHGTRAGHDEILSLGIVLLRVAEDLPWTPRIFLVPKSGHIQVWNGLPCNWFTHASRRQNSS